MIPIPIASVAANAGGGSVSAGFATSAGAGSAPAAHSAKSAAAAAEAEDLDNEAGKASAKAPGSRDVAGSGNNNLAASWKSGTFRSRFEATKFVTKASADQIIALTATRNSRFEQDSVATNRYSNGQRPSRRLLKPELPALRQTGRRSRSLQMKKKQPILVLLLLTFLVIAGVVNHNHQQAALSGFKKMNREVRERNIIAYLQISRELGKAEKWDELQAVLEYAVGQNLIDFYTISSGDTLYWWGDRSKNLEHIPADVPAGEEPLRREGQDPVIALATVVGENKVAIGIDKDFNPQEAILAKRKDALFFEELIYFSLIALFAAFWSLKDIFKIVKLVRTGKVKGLKAEQMASQESDLFLRGILGYEQTVNELEDVNRRLDRQVLPSLKKEITSGKKPPYDFECTMVRTDINNFSTIYNTHNVTEFMATINRFFAEVSVVVARYQGLVHEFVGDEVIFYFKDDEHENSFAIALSAVRDINEIATRYHHMTTEARGYPFTVKSSLSHGRVRFGPLVNGFTIAGSVLIETVRILSHIHEKDGNVIYYDGANHARLFGLIEGAERQRVQLKGFQDEKVLFQYQRHLDLAILLEQLDVENANRLTYYRSDRDLGAILRNLRENSRRRPVQVSLKAVQVLRRAYVATAVEGFSDLLVAWLSELETWRKETKEGSGVEVLSATVVMLFINLVPKEHLSASAQDRVKSLLDAGENRIVANAMDVLIHFEAPVEKKAVTTVRKSDDLRQMANALVYEGKDELKPAVIKTLAKLMARNQDLAKVASGLYAIGELARIHRDRDLVYYTAQVDFTKLVEQIDSYVVHPNAMIRRQSMIALRKIMDPELLNRAVESLVSADSNLLNEEASKHLWPYWDPSKISKSKAS